MRILIATSDYPPALGGMAAYSAAWADGLARAGAEVHVLARRVGQLPHGRMPAIPAEYIDWPSGPLRDPFHALRHLARTLDRLAPDIVMAHTWIGWAPALAWLKGRRGTRFVVGAHGAEILGPIRSPYYRFLMRLGLKAADRIFPVSSFTAAHVASLGISRERIEVIGNGVDPNRYAPAPRNQAIVKRLGLAEHEIIHTVGGLVDRKGHDIVIRAVALLKDKRPRLKYVIVGGWALNSSREAFLRSLVRETGTEDRVIFTGFVDDADLADYYRLGDLFVMPGREMKERGWVEGFGISYLEAAACGVPVIATRTGGVEEAVTPENGLFVPVENPEATAQAIDELLGDAERRRRMSESGLAWARRNAWSEKSRQGYEIMKELLRK